MAASLRLNVDTDRARQLWEENQEQHDLTGRRGQTAGIDPVSGRIWIGESMRDVINQRNAAGIGAPLYFVRIGSPAYYRRGRSG